MTTRAAGILLHPTSLAGDYGVGDLGPEADRFLGWARDAGQSWWQVLPLGPPGGGHNAPYSCLSAFAGNPLLISPELLCRQGLLAPSDLDGVPSFPADQVDFAAVKPWKSELLRRSWERFQNDAPDGDRRSLEAFAEASDNAWLDDWTLFMAARRKNPGAGWWDWPGPVKRREPGALDDLRRAEAGEIAYQRYLQWQFFSQWQRLRDQAHEHGVRILGDLPIYVAWDSAEVWANPHLFQLDDEGRPLAVAGVPPDDFSDTGQLWGNPLYRWEGMAEDGYAWWTARLAANLRTCDRLRLDHFRGFAGYWSVPAGEETAEHGTWIDGPGRAMFDAWRENLGDLPLVAEDLGVITPDVEQLRRDAGLPGIKVLHFGFGETDSEHLPHNFERRSVVYTGTHDNDTTAGWYRSLDRETRRRVRRYAGGGKVHRALVRLAYASVAELAVVPAQDVLGLGAEARMNTPAVAEGNWAWRLAPGALTAEHARRLRALAELSGRLPA